MDLRTYLVLLRRRWWLILLGPLLAVAVAFFASRQMTPIYEASSTVLVNQTQNPGSVQYNDILTSERLTNTYAKLIKRHQVLNAVRVRLGLNESEAALADRIKVSIIRNTQLLQVTVQDRDPSRAVLIADTTAQAFIDENTQSLGRPGTVTIADGAQVPISPVKPNPKLNAVLAGLLALLIAGVLAALLEYLDDTVKPTDELDSIVGLANLGVIRRLKRRRNEPAIAFAPEAIEAFSHLRMSVHFASIGPKTKTIVVTSPGPGDGKSTVAAGLAVLLAQAGEKVIIVDADLRRPTLHRVFQVPNSFGLTGLLLSNRSDPDVALVPSGIQNLELLPSGPTPPNPADLLISPKMEAIIRDLQAQVDYVVFDCPPILAVTDACVLAARTDATILVAEAGRTRRIAVRRATEELTRTGARMLGIVLNKAKQKKREYYGDYAYAPTKGASPAVGKSRRPPGPDSAAGKTAA